MSTLRCVLAVAAGGAFGCGFAFLILGLGHTNAGIAIAAGGVCLIVLDCIRYVQKKRDRTRLGREAVWLRRDRTHEVRRVL